MMKFLLLFIMTSATAIASGDGHHDGHISDLIAPAFNVLVLFGFLVFKLRGPLKNHYTSKSSNVSETLERASAKAKEAKLKLELHQKKLYTVEEERGEIVKNAQKQVDEFEKTYKQEMHDKTEKLKSDAALKVEHEKNSLVQNMNKEFVEKMIAKVKNDVSQDSVKQQKIAANMLGQL